LNFYENPSSVSRTDRHDEANSRFSKLCEGAPKQVLLRNTHWDVIRTVEVATVPSPVLSQELKPMLCLE